MSGPTLPTTPAAIPSPLETPVYTPLTPFPDPFRIALELFMRDLVSVASATVVLVGLPAICVLALTIGMQNFPAALGVLLTTCFFFGVSGAALSYARHFGGGH